MSMVASVKLMNLFEVCVATCSDDGCRGVVTRPSLTRCDVSALQLFSSSKFLFARPDNYQFVVQLVDTFNNIVQYQYEGNTHVVYSLVRRRRVVEQVTIDGRPTGDSFWSRIVRSCTARGSLRCDSCSS
jgi:hypothetical protein